MSSLLQFNGTVDRSGVHIQCYLSGDKGFLGAKETVTNPKTGRELPVLYTFARKPAGMLGCWVVFRYLGEEHVPNLSCPLGLDSLPRGAVRLSDSETLKAWSS